MLWILLLILLIIAIGGGTPMVGVVDRVCARLSDGKNECILGRRTDIPLVQPFTQRGAELTKFAGFSREDAVEAPPGERIEMDGEYCHVVLARRLDSQSEDEMIADLGERYSDE